MSFYAWQHPFLYLRGVQSCWYLLQRESICSSFARRIFLAFKLSPTQRKP